MLPRSAATFLHPLVGRFGRLARQVRLSDQFLTRELFLTLYHRSRELVQNSYILVHGCGWEWNLLPGLPPHEALLESLTVHVMCNDHIRSVHYIGLSLSELIGFLRSCWDVQIRVTSWEESDTCLFLISLVVQLRWLVSCQIWNTSVYYGMIGIQVLDNAPYG